MTMKPKKRQVRVEQNTLVAPEVHRLSIALPPGETLDFEPGEFVTFYVPKGPVTVTRSYSIASDPQERERFDLLVKRVEDGYVSTFLCARSPGDELTVLGPLGKFLLRDPGARSVVFACTGTGIAPFLPMTRRLLRDHPSQMVWLFFGGRTEPEILGRSELDSIQRTHPTFHFVPTLSRPGAGWTGAVGHIETPIQAQFPTLSGCDLYICGVPEMVTEVLNLGTELGCPRERMYIERY
ncbi:MAG: ferredoxin--NADP reductase [Thermoplasmata archaeon]